MSIIRGDDVHKLEIRVGTIVSVEEFPEANEPAFKLQIDLGNLGIKKSSAQITALYAKDDLIGKQVICVTNSPPRQIADFMSEVLTTGFVLESGKIALAVPDKKVPNGAKLI